MSTQELKSLIGQCFIVGFHGHEPSPDIRTLIADYHVGGVILMKRNVQDAYQTRTLVHALQQIAHDAGHARPLLIGIDQENGLVSAFSSPTAATQFPGAMAIAAAADPALTRTVAEATGAELRHAGINWASAPWSHHIPCRCLRQALPGHGDTHTDSHHALPIIPKPLSALSACELIPFRTLITSGIPSIMTAHIALPQLHAGVGEDADVPASLSARVTRLLRGELGFGGVVVTDCLEMAAVAALPGGVPLGAERALAAGTDVVMICHTFSYQRDAVQRAWGAAAEGRLQKEDLEASARRVGAMKDQYAGTWANVLSSPFDEGAWRTQWATLKSQNTPLSTSAYARTPALLFPAPASALPIPPSTSGMPLLLLTPHPQRINPAVDSEEPGDGTLLTPAGTLRNTAGAAFLALAESVRARHSCTHVVYSPSSPPPSLASYTTIIIALPHCPALCALHIRPNARVVILSTCAPYDLADVPGVRREGVAGIACFEFTPPAFEAVVRVLFGEAQAGGRVPVKGCEVCE
ncbi:glycoside hydrolase superfamily [Infundibulicybe gibba]|nr:glycoside hydrolase superfamily [Infundibulicybe gibba]